MAFGKIRPNQKVWVRPFRSVPWHRASLLVFCFFYTTSHLGFCYPCYPWPFGRHGSYADNSSRLWSELLCILARRKRLPSTRSGVDWNIITEIVMFPYVIIDWYLLVGGANGANPCWFWYFCWLMMLIVFLFNLLRNTSTASQRPNGYPEISLHYEDGKLRFVASPWCAPTTPVKVMPSISSGHRSHENPVMSRVSVTRAETLRWCWNQWLVLLET